MARPTSTVVLAIWALESGSVCEVPGHAPYRLCVQFEWMGLNVRYGRCTIRLGCCARFGGVVFVKKRAVWAFVVLSVMLSAVPAASAASWSLTPVPSPDGASASLSSVSCASAKLCVAVGQTGSNQAFSAVWRNGRWSIVPVAAPSGVLPSNLSSVSCAANGRCVAVGGYCTDFCQGNAALSELFNGTGWVIEPTPPSTFEQNTLSAVSCSSASACTAVGGASSDISMQLASATLIYRWNGSRWSSQTPPALNGVGLTAVSCSSAIDCTAAGSTESSVAARWNGVSWSAHTTADPAAIMLGVSCSAGTACTAVGYDSPQTPPDTTRAERWNGVTWSDQTSPSPNVNGSRLLGVSCAAARSCTAVGYANGALAERWTGTSWSEQPTPNPAGAAPYAVPQLQSVSCTDNGTVCMAVGDYADTAGVTRLLAERTMARRPPKLPRRA
jgi:hypothetical protein